MKQEARSKLIRDVVAFLVTGGITAAIGLAITASTASEMDSSRVVTAILIGFVCGGVYHGWQWASRIITAVSLPGVVLKFFIALFTGFIAFPITLIADLIGLLRAK
ncbi:MAG: hypothetical protein NC084_11240 [Bacteroides sp.]|nr:hypothetical protein [Eubacterium sp.]MCM1419511.1 hypothetical protein [Roseburia sp.]MCM1463264.1 hypothetical protein [Bacteroides sp.]